MVIVSGVKGYAVQLGESFVQDLKKNDWIHSSRGGVESSMILDCYDNVVHLILFFIYVRQVWKH